MVTKGGKRGFLGDSLIVLVLLLIVLAVPMIIPPEKRTFTGNVITAGVVSPVSLSKTSFAPNEKLSGDVKIAFRANDLIPENSKMYFFFQSPKCPRYFFCSEGNYIPWCNYSSNGECKCVSEQTLKSRCGGPTTAVYCENPNIAIDTYCCEQRGMIGSGYYHQNLICSSGGCWSSCQGLDGERLTSMISYSSTPSSGNYTQGKYNNVDGDDPPGSGQGFSGCGSGAQITKVGEYTVSPLLNDIIGYAVQEQQCYDTDGSDVYVQGRCTDYAGKVYIDTCIIGVAEDKIVEYVCGTDQRTCEAKQAICPYGCYNGACKKLSCVESDGGDKPYVFGTCTDGTGKTYTDNCLAGAAEDILTEYYCSSTSKLCTSKQYICPEGCTTGACKSSVQQEPKCIDSDLGRVYDTKGICIDPTGKSYTDTCIAGVAEDILKEYYCKDPLQPCASEQVTCVYGCYDGACKSQSTVKCVDPDGSNHLVKGTCSDATGKYIDTCIAGVAEDMVTEYICGEDQRCKPVQITCPLGCYDGACKSQPATKCSDPDGKNYYLQGTCVDYLGGYTDYCLAGVADSDKVVEYSCSEDLNKCTTSQYTCPYGCYSGACKNPKCEDNDGGDKPYVFGTCTDYKGQHKDYCDLTSKGILNEYYCSTSADVCTKKQYQCPYGCSNGVCAEPPSQPPPQELPDLTVAKIYQGSANIQGNKNLYSTIVNKGEGNAGSFEVCAYFAGTSSVNCFYKYKVIGLSYGKSIELDMGIVKVEGKTVAVHADYYDIIKEINENNNVLTKYFPTAITCSCSDGGFNPSIFGTCSDGSITNVVMKDECLTDGDTLKEWYCNTKVEPQVCEYQLYKCKSNGFSGCEAGACVKQNYVECKETDNGDDPFNYGSCTDSTGTYKDECTATKLLKEYYCAKGTSVEQLAICTIKNHDCEYGCSGGECMSSGGAQPSQYSCDGWNSIYDVALSSVPSLSAPSKEGVYNLSVLFIHSVTNEVTLLSSSSSSTFVVEEQTQSTEPTTTYKACINQQCIVVQGSGQDECETSPDCVLAPTQPIACVNYIAEVDCLYAGCYWYENSCHDNPEFGQLAQDPPYYAQTTQPESVEQTLTGIAWWIWLIIGLVLALIIILVIVKKGLPLPKKSNKAEKKELQRKYPALIAYINKAKEGGMLKEHLRDKLMSKGWPVGVIDKALNNFWETKSEKKKKKELKKQPETIRKI